MADLVWDKGIGLGGPNRDRPMCELRAKDPEKYMASLRIAARARLEGASWLAAARQSSLSYNTLKSWNKNGATKGGRVWRAVLAELAAQMKVTPQGELLEPERAPAVSTAGFDTPEQFCDHWSLEAARVQVETMVDPKSPRKERLDASKRVQDLGGHSPVSRSVVITAPLDDPRVAQALLGVLEELKQLPPPRAAESAHEAEAGAGA